MAVSVACMAVYWPTGFKRRTFKLCVLIRTQLSTARGHYRHMYNNRGINKTCINLLLRGLCGYEVVVMEILKVLAVCVWQSFYFVPIVSWWLCDRKCSICIHSLWLSEASHLYSCGESYKSLTACILVATWSVSLHPCCWAKSVSFASLWLNEVFHYFVFLWLSHQCYCILMAKRSVSFAFLWSVER